MAVKETITLYEKKTGVSLEFHRIDAKEALAGGKYTAEDPAAKDKPKAVTSKPTKPEPDATEQPGSVDEQGDTGAKQGLMLKNTKSLIAMAISIGITGASKMHKVDLIDALIAKGAV